MFIQLLKVIKLDKVRHFPQEEDPNSVIRELRLK
jgi:hypothetical protein